MISGEKIVDFKTFVVHKDGHLIPVEFSGQMIKKGNRSYFNAVMRDISAQMKVEEKLKVNEEKYRSIFESSREGILIASGDGKIIDVNPAALEILGYESSEELVGKPTSGGYAFPEQRAKLFKDLMRTGYVKNREIVFKRKDGSFVHTLGSATLYRSKDGGTFRVVGIFSDITERKKAEKQLVESEEKFKNLAEQSPNMIYINRKGKVVYANKVCENIMGYSREVFYSPDFNFLNIIAPEYKDMVRESFKMHMDGKEVSPYEYALITKKGKRIEAIHTTKLIQYEGKHAILGIVTDITKHKKIEEDIRQMKDHLQNIIDSTSELVFVVDKNLNISTWNKIAELTSGYKQREVIGKSLKSYDLFDNLDSVIVCVESINKNEITTPFELILRTKTGAKRLLKVSCSSLRSETGEKKGVLFMGRDITKESETHGKLIPGNSYIITDKTNDPAIHLFKDLTITGYSGLFITRDTPEAIQNNIQSLENVEAIILSQEKIMGFEHAVDLDELTKKIESFTAKNSRPLILLDRIDYLITNFSFDAVIKVLYSITDTISRNKGVLLVRLNPSVINISQLAVIEEELKPLPSQKIDAIELEDYLYGVLKFIDEQHQHNILVSFKKIGQKFSISKVTTAKRLNILEEKGLIFIKKHGKTKTIHISEKGKTLLHRRKII
ncbi:MAG: PAS domain S-box protein [Thermoplasmatales archaeon]|nr:MAG: PAS domain S-box protein [Thermoplasmatales archaeon]